MNAFFDYRGQVLSLWSHTGLKISIEPAPQASNRLPAEEAFYARTDASDLFARVPVNAPDPIAALRTGERRLSDALAALKIYRPGKTPAHKGKVSLVLEADRAHLVNRDRSRRKLALADSTNVSDRLDKLLRVITNLNRDDRQQFSAALQYHRSAIEAGHDENRLVNLWIALECIARRGSNSTIENVCACVPSAIALNNPGKYLRDALKYVKSACSGPKRNSLSALFAEGNPGYPSAAGLLDILLDEKNGPRIEALYALTQGNPLATHRIHLLRNKIFRSPNCIRDNLEMHRRNIDWQIRRIYRGRNHVMHRGKSTPTIVQLTQHLHSYFIELVNLLVHDLLLNRKWSIADSLEYRRVLFDRYVLFLRGDAQRNITRKMLVDPAAVLSPVSGEAAWAPVAPKGSLGR